MADQALKKPIVIWLDGTFDGHQADVLPPTQQRFQNDITAPPPLSNANIMHLICGDNHPDRVTVGKVVEIAWKLEDAYDLIKKHHDKRIFFVSSGTLGRTAIPYITNNYSNIFSFYIFCYNKAIHVDWAIQYLPYLRMFTHHIDLLVQLMRDMSKYFIDFGKPYLTTPSTDRTISLKYFRHAEYLENKANELDYIDPKTMRNETVYNRSPRRIFLDQLEGNNGLIKQAERVANSHLEHDNIPMETDH